MARYGMVIDLKRCYSCYACVVACKAKNFTPPGVLWARVLKGETGKFPNTVRQALPVLCFHCEEPSCESVCPTGATKIEEGGIVVVDKEICIGCSYCKMACPYGARYMVEEWQSYFPKGAPMSEYERYAKKRWEEERGVGVSTKCDFCKDRIPKGDQPACVKACPAKARTFGDLDDPMGEVALLIKRGRGYQLQPELGNEPKVYYLPPR